MCSYKLKTYKYKYMNYVEYKLNDHVRPRPTNLCHQHNKKHIESKTVYIFRPPPPPPPRPRRLYFV